MQQVKVLDANGKLKYILSPEEVQKLSDEKFERESGAGSAQKRKRKGKNAGSR